MKNPIYKQLMDCAEEGKQAALVSKYSGNKVVKTLAFRDDTAVWDNPAVDGEPLLLQRNGDDFTLTEFFAPKPRLIVFGAGHIAVPLCVFGTTVGFKTTIYDDRPSFANAARFPSADCVLCDAFENIAKRINVRSTDYVVIVTRGHRHDGDCLRAVLSGEFPAYLGMIGSRRRVAIVKNQLVDEGYDAKKLALLHSPIGLAIGAVTPEEIAVSIISEIVKVMRLGETVIEGFKPENRYYMDFDEKLISWLAENDEEAAALVTIVETDGSTPREAGAQMAVLLDGRIIGSIGGGCAESDVAVKARDVIRDGGYCLFESDMTDSAEDDGMVCGGTMSVLIEALR